MLFQYKIMFLLVISILLTFASPQARSSGNYVEYINFKENGN